MSRRRRVLASFDDIRVCDLSGQLAGAGATKILAAFGAEVIRVENPNNDGRWDILRGGAPFVDERRGIELGGGFNNHNVGKRGVTLDLKSPEGRQAFEKLVQVSDVVTENFGVGVMDRLGLGYERLRQLKPDIIYASHTGFGHGGPYEQFKSWGPLAQAVSGLSVRVGLPEVEPAGWGYSYMDHYGALMMAAGVLAALEHRARTGEGQYVEVAAMETGLTLHGPALLDWTVNGRRTSRPGQPNGNHATHAEMSPHGIYRARGQDRWIAIACRDDADWAALAAVVAEPWMDDFQLRSLPGRLAGEAELDAGLERWTARHEADELADWLISAGIPASVVKTPPERIDSDPDVAGWGLWPEVTHPAMGRVRVDGLPLRLSASPWAFRRAGPLLGQDNRWLFEHVLGADSGRAAAATTRPDRAGGQAGAPSPAGTALGPLEGLRVLEIPDENTAPLGKMLGDLGADVIVIEPPGGSSLRSLPPFVDDVPGPEQSLRWWSVATSKRSITLDLDTGPGLKLFSDLLREADVVVEGMSRGEVADRGLDPSRAVENLRRLIWATITPFDRTGPRADEPSTDLTLLAGGGPVWSCGYDDHENPPLRGHGYQSANIAMAYGLIGVLVALHHRRRFGQGQHVEVDINAACNVTTEHGSYDWLVAGAIVQRQTGRHAAPEPTQPLQIRCVDGRYALTGPPGRTPADYQVRHRWLEDLSLVEKLPEAFFLKLGAARPTGLRADEIRSDPEAAAMVETARRAMSVIAGHLTARELFEQAQQRGIAAGALFAPEEAFENQHLGSRRFAASVEHPELGRTVRYPGPPFRTYRSPWRISRRPPLVGEHTAEILAESGRLGSHDP